MATIYARILNQYKYKYQTVFSARFDTQTEDNQLLKETELYINININHTLTDNDLDKINVRFALEDQIQTEEIEELGWIFDRNISLIIDFDKIGEMNGSSYVKIPLRSSAILNNQIDEKQCFLWSIFSHLHPVADSKNGHPRRDSNYR